MSNITQDTLDFTNAKANALIQNTSNKRVKNTLEELKEVCNKIIKEGNEVSPIEIEKYTQFEKRKITAQFIYNDRQKAGNYKALLDLYEQLGITKKIDSTIKSKSKADFPLTAQIIINNLNNRNRMLENILKEQFLIREASNGISIQELVEAGSSGDDSIDIESTSTLISDTQRLAIKTIFNELLDRSCDLKGEGNSQRLVCSLSKQTILQPISLKALNSLI